MLNHKQNIDRSLAKESDLVPLHVLSIKSGLDVVPLDAMSKEEIFKRTREDTPVGTCKSHVSLASTTTCKRQINVNVSSYILLHLIYDNYFFFLCATFAH